MIRNFRIFIVAALLLAALPAAGGDATGPVTLEQATAAALESVADGKVVYAGADLDDGRTVFDIIIIDASDRHEFEIDAQTGATLDYEKELIVKTLGPATGDGAEAARERLDRATAAALAASNGGDIVDIEEELEDGRAVFSIDIINAGRLHEFEIEAATANIIEHEVEDM